MRLKRLISICLIFALIATCLVGCKKEEGPTEPIETPDESEPAKDLDDALKDAINWDDPDSYDDNKDISIDVNVGNNDENKDEGTYVEPTLPDDWDGMAIDPEVEVEKVVWEKEFNKIGLNSIRVDSKWNEYIIVGGAKVSALTKTDFSVMPNFWFDGDYQPADVQTAYFVPHVGLIVNKEFQFSNLVTGLLDVETTSGTHNLFVERIAYTLLHSPLDGSLTQIASANDYKEGEVGIGSTYDDVIAVLGNPSNVDSFDSGIGYKNIILSYGSEKSRLVVEFTLKDSDSQDKAIVTGLDWLAMAVKDELRMQPGIETFVGYVDENQNQ